jgi:hypothetical protein
VTFAGFETPVVPRKRLITSMSSASMRSPFLEEIQSPDVASLHLSSTRLSSQICSV